MRKTRGGCFRFHVVHALLLLAFVDIAFTEEEPPPPRAHTRVARSPRARTPARAIEYRLPTAVTPSYYDLQLTLQIDGSDPNEFKVKGYVLIYFKCHVVTNNVTLNVKDLTVNLETFKFTDVDVPFPKTANFETYEVVQESQLLIITLKEYLNCDLNYKIEMDFIASITNTPEGIFYSSYQANGQTQYYVATKFEPIHARKAFPCFDEPHIKTQFRLTIRRPNTTISIANTERARPVEERLVDGYLYQEDHFEIHPFMSTYTLAFVVGNFSNTLIYDKSGYNVGVYSHEENAEFIRYGADLAVKLLKFFESYFGQELKQKKLDFVALPSSVASPNFGLNIYSDSRLLYNESVHTEEDKLLVARTVSYATARQWSGAMISPEWWSYLWLVEGLAGYFEHSGIDSVESEWKTWEHFVLDKLHVALLNDGSLSSRPVHRQVQEPEAIEDMYDWVAYKKAPSLLRMVSFFLGTTDFKSIISKYVYHLADLSRRDARYHEVLPSLTKSLLSLDISLMNLVDIMEPWILQINYPVVTVIRDFNNQSVVHVTQKRFLSDPKAKDPGFYKSSHKYRWTIPLTFTSSKELNFDKKHTDVYWLKKEDRVEMLSPNVSLPDINDKDGWILANVKQYGYYRVNYQIGNWMALSRQLNKNHKKIDSINRAQIISDAWNLARAYYLPLEIALSTIEYLDKERDYLPWYTAWRELRFVESVLANHYMYKPFQAFIRNKTVGALQEFGLLTNLTDHMQIFTRSLVADLACQAEPKECRNHALPEYHKWKTTKTNGIPINVRKVVYCNDMAIGSNKEWKFAQQELKTAQFDSQKNILLAAMSCSHKKDRLNQLLKLLLDSDFVLKENQPLNIITSVVQNKFGKHSAWMFYRNNFKKLTAKFPSFNCSNTLPAIVEMFHTEKELQEVTVFIRNHCPKSENDIQQQCVDKIRTNIDWVKQNLQIIKKWLKDKGYHNK